MILPNIWGQGQLFAFSAIDGNAYLSDDFTGMLSGDRIGIKFYSNTRRELAIVGYKTDMWKGPVWINFNYMIINGLLDYGYKNTALDITEKTIDTVNQWYEETGVVFEFFDSSNKLPPYRLKRKGDPIEPYNIDVRVQTIRDFGWSACLTCDMIKNIL